MDRLDISVDFVENIQGAGSRECNALFTLCMNRALLLLALFCQMVTIKEAAMHFLDIYKYISEIFMGLVQFLTCHFYPT